MQLTHAGTSTIKKQIVAKAVQPPHHRLKGSAEPRDTTCNCTGVVQGQKDYPWGTPEQPVAV